jgi:hypothetical protein
MASIARRYLSKIALRLSFNVGVMKQLSLARFSGTLVTPQLRVGGKELDHRAKALR